MKKSNLQTKFQKFYEQLDKDYSEFRNTELLKTKEDIFNNSYKIYVFYEVYEFLNNIELDSFLNESDMCRFFDEASLTILYDYYLKYESLSITNWEDIKSMIKDFLHDNKREKRIKNAIYL